MQASCDIARTPARRLRRRVTRRIASAVMLAAISPSRALGTIYYVSPTGSDSASGTSPAAPWGSVAKVDSTNFQPGDQILFQYGSIWNASLDATSSGTSAAPIVYGAYGKPPLGNPTFSGSDPISPSVFSLVSGTTYVYTSPVAVNYVYTFNSPATESQDYLTANQLPGANDPTTNLSTVENLPFSFYYNQASSQLYVNLGAPLTNQPIALGTRDNAIYNNYQSNLIFRNLNTTQTMVDAAGYGIRVENGANVTILNSTVTQAGKHSVGLIDSTGINVTNVVADGSQPWLGFGGASAYVSFADASTGPVSVNNTSVYTNDSYINPNGPYALFITHGGDHGIASVALNNMVSVTSSEAGCAIYSTSADEVVTVSGGNFNGTMELDTSNSLVNGATFTGPHTTVGLSGSRTVVQNNVFNGSIADFGGNEDGAVFDSGTNNTVRFNVVNVTGDASGITSGSQTTNTNIYGNIVVDLANPSKDVGVGMNGFANGPLNSNYNLFAPGTTFIYGSPTVIVDAAQWRSMGYDINSLFTGASFNNSSDGDFSLQTGSAGTGLVPISEIDSTLSVANSLLGSTSGNGNYNAGLNPYIPSSLALLAANVLVDNASVMTIIAPINGQLTIQPQGSLTVLSTASLDLSCAVFNSGTFASTGSLIQTGNFNNSGSVYLSGSQLWSPGTVFTNVAGNAVFATDAGGSIAPVGYLSINVIGGTVIFASSQHLAGLSVSYGGTLQVAQESNGSQSIINTPSLSVTGHLDLTNNDLIVQGGDISALTALVREGSNHGNWNGSGISSSVAAADSLHLTAIGIILNSTDGFDPLYGISGTRTAQLGLFDGQTPNYNDVLIKYTYVGDANLDGKVDGSDYSLIDNGYTQQLTGWYNGDFNYDGVVDGSDYALIDNAFNSQGGSLESAISTTQIAVVPEPIGAISLTFSAAALACRRRRG